MRAQGIEIVAEAGVNHNGSSDLAKRLIDVAVASGVDTVKFQTFKANKLVSSSAPKAAYQICETEKGESQLEMLRKLELSADNYEELAYYCRHRGIEFLSSTFDLESTDFLVHRLNLQRIKIPSGEITNAPLLLHIANQQRSIILSTGMSTLEEIEIALGVLAFGFLNLPKKPSLDEFQRVYHSTEGQRVLQNKVTLLHCTTEYPAPLEEVNLKAMEKLRQTFGLPIGFSDHTLGISTSIAAAALGAVLIEKHYTLDRNLPGPDHRASLEPAELRQMVESIRQVEKALGTACKIPTASELKNRPVARRSLVAACDIRKGEKFYEENLAIKRPGSGISPIQYWNWIGKEAERDYMRDEVIQS